MSKRIVIDARFYGLENAGLGRYSINLIENLIKIDNNNEYILLLREKYFNKLKLPKNFKKVLCDIPHYTIREQLYLPQIIMSYKPDVFHALQINFPILYIGKSMITIHDTTQLNMDNKATTLSKPLYLIKSLAIKVAFKVAIRKCSTIFVPTKQVERDLLNRGVDISKIKVTYEGVDDIKVNRTSKILKKLNLKEKYFVYVGNAYPHKNVETAIDAIKKINEEADEKIQLVLVSARNEFTNRLQGYAKKIGAMEYVIFAGFIPDNDLGHLLNKSVAFVYPSKMEGFGLPGLEAMSSGAPVIASDIPVFKEVYGKHANYFDPESVDDLTSSMTKVLNMDKSKRSKMIIENKKFIKKYSWKEMTRMTQEEYLK